MTTYNDLKKIIPPDQALANEALSRSLRQVKQIFDTDLPSFAAAVSVLESNKDLDLINQLDSPLPEIYQDWISTTLGTGTGPGNTLTTNDVIGIAAGATVDQDLPLVTAIVSNLSNAGALVSLTANAGTANSASNGIYTQMQYCLAGAYGTGNVNIPATAYFPGGTFVDLDDAFGNGLIPAANSAITNIATVNSTQATTTNQAIANIANQLVLNVDNSIAAGIDIANVVNDIANANLVSNSISSSLSLATQLHDIGLDVTVGGQAQFFEAVANLQNTPGQAVIASMREGRNIAVLNAVGIELDTQLVDVNLNTTVANNLQDAQYSVSEAQANIVY